MNISAKERVIAKLSQGATRAEAASEAGVCERTIYNWLTDAAFRKAITNQTNDHFRSLIGAMVNASLLSVRYLEGVVEGKTKADNLKIRAASALIGNCINLKRAQDQIESTEILNRMETLISSNGRGKN